MATLSGDYDFVEDVIERAYTPERRLIEARRVFRLCEAHGMMISWHFVEVLRMSWTGKIGVAGEPLFDHGVVLMELGY